MLHTDGAPDREPVGFLPDAIEAFRFLTDEYGFKCIRELSTLVSYESSLVFVNVVHGRSSFGIRFEIGRRTDPEELRERLSMPEILSAVGAPESQSFKGFQASTAGAVKQCVRALADLVKRYAGPLLKGDSSAFEEVRRVQNALSMHYLDGMEMRRVRQKVAIAWREKRFAEVVDLLLPVVDSLTPAENKKLSFAQKQIAKLQGELQRVR